MKEGKKWIVCGDEPYYPWVLEFDSEKKARKEYEKATGFDGSSVYLAVVVEKKTSAKAKRDHKLITEELIKDSQFQVIEP